MTTPLSKLSSALATRVGDRPIEILVVDANPETRQRLVVELSRHEWTTREAGSPLEAIASIERERCDAVAIGWTLTPGRARQLAGFLAEAYPDLPVWIVSDPGGPEPGLIWRLREAWQARVPAAA
jgi:DNA-binding NtrC family response regulator